MIDPVEAGLRAALARPAGPSSDFDLNPDLQPEGGKALRPAAVLVPVWLRPEGAVLILTKRDGLEQFFGIDEGLLVKTGHQVDIAIRRGVQGEDLDSLNDTVQASFVEMDEEERTARTALSRLEGGIVRRFGDLRKPVA